MDPLETVTESFIIRIWVERRSPMPERDTWRGKIVHVNGGEGRLVQNFDDITLFILPYIEALGVTPSLRWRTRRWLRRVRLRAPGFIRIWWR